MNEIFSAGDLANAFYITPSIAIIHDKEIVAIQVCIFKWFVDVTIKRS
tara:strand:- start:111 stop:254 length:144 start_codon:yes stop_codon:yes gene_type:complete